MAENTLNRPIRGNQMIVPHTYAGGAKRLSKRELEQQALEAFYRHRAQQLRAPEPGAAPVQGNGIMDYLGQIMIHPANLLNYVTGRISDATK